MDMTKMGTFLQTLRKEQGLTQEQLGEKLHISSKTISRWETGTYMPLQLSSTAIQGPVTTGSGLDVNGHNTDTSSPPLKSIHSATRGSSRLTVPSVAFHSSTLPVARKKHSEPFSTFITI